VALTLDERAFAYWSPSQRRWVVEAGDFEIQVGASSRDIRLRRTVRLDGNGPEPALTGQSTLAEWLAHPRGAALLDAAGYLRKLGFADGNLIPMVAATPLCRLVSFLGGVVSRDDVERLVLAAREAGPEPAR
jgi:beta-glucosidase